MAPEGQPHALCSPPVWLSALKATGRPPWRTGRRSDGGYPLNLGHSPEQKVPSSPANGETEAQRGWATCPVLLSWSVAEPLQAWSLQPPLGTTLSSCLQVRIERGGRGWWDRGTAGVKARSRQRPGPQKRAVSQGSSDRERRGSNSKDKPSPVGMVSCAQRLRTALPGTRLCAGIEHVVVRTWQWRWRCGHGGG